MLREIHLIKHGRDKEFYKEKGNIVNTKIGKSKKKAELFWKMILNLKKQQNKQA